MASLRKRIYHAINEPFDGKLRELFLKNSDVHNAEQQREPSLWSSAYHLAQNLSIFSLRWKGY